MGYRTRRQRAENEVDIERTEFARSFTEKNFVRFAQAGRSCAKHPRRRHFPVMDAFAGTKLAGITCT